MFREWALRFARRSSRKILMFREWALRFARRSSRKILSGLHAQQLTK
jgi:hypothetical protein